MGGACSQGKETQEKIQAVAEKHLVPNAKAASTPTTAQGVSLEEFLATGGTEAEFRKLDRDNNGILDKQEVEVLDISTWDAKTAKEQSEELCLKDPEPLIKYLTEKGNAKMPKYNMQVSLQDRGRFRQFFKKTVGLSKGDAQRLDRGACRMTVMRLRLGRPQTFSDAFDDEKFDSEDDEVNDTIVEDEEEEEEATAATAGPNGAGTRAALVIDDSMVERAVCKGILQKIGYEEVDEAEDGQVGLEKMQAKSYDVVFLDISMPVMDGMECIQKFRQWEKTNRSGEHQFVCCVTGDEDKTSRQFMSAGMDDVIHKDYSMGLIQAVTGQLCNTQAAANLTATKPPAPTGDASSWSSKELLKNAKELDFMLDDMSGLVSFLDAGNRLRGYSLQTQEEDRDEHRAWLIRMVVGLTERDALKIDRGLCRWTVQQLRMGRPNAFADAFNEDSDNE